ncbi:hypothetical protein GZL_03893 [Streptomyces sp. 769]|nr:hypothetical protein GZL_03893 [Streptomyces sp. 769]
MDGDHHRRPLRHQPGAETHRRRGVQQHRHTVDAHVPATAVRRPPHTRTGLRAPRHDMRAPAHREEIRGGRHRRAVDPHRRAAGRDLRHQPAVRTSHGHSAMEEISARHLPCHPRSRQRFLCTVSRPSFMSTCSPTRETDAPCPLLMWTPVASIRTYAPLGASSKIPSVGTSDITILCFPGVWITTGREIAGSRRASSGNSSRRPYQHPTHTGKLGSPCSNSTHTPAPTDGTTTCPACSPVNGKHGSAQVDTSSPNTSGTWTFNLPTPIGSSFAATRPRNLPRKRLFGAAAMRGFSPYVPMDG